MSSYIVWNNIELRSKIWLWIIMLFVRNACNYATLNELPICVLFSNSLTITVLLVLYFLNVSISTCQYIVKLIALTRGTVFGAFRFFVQWQWCITGWLLSKLGSSVQLSSQLAWMKSSLDRRVLLVRMYGWKKAWMWWRVWYVCETKQTTPHAGPMHVWSHWNPKLVIETRKTNLHSCHILASLSSARICWGSCPSCSS